MSGTYIAVIPAYEPDDHLPDLVSRLITEGLIPIVVNDGSGAEYDGIFRLVSDLATVLTHEVNKGKGRALKTAYSYILKNFPKDSVIVTMDCDGQHTTADALHLCAMAAEHPDSLILGSRRQSKSSPLRSRFGNAVTRFVFRLSSGAKVYDTQTGLRAFSAGLLSKMLTIDGERYEYEMNTLMVFARKSIPIREVPIETIYINKNKGSHFDTVKDSFRIYKEIIKFSASSLTGFVTDYALYTLLSLLTLNMPGSAGLVFSNIVARVVSASLNFTLNRIFVFRSKGSFWKAAIQYFALAACILAGNTLVLNFLVTGLGLNRYLAKIFTEITFFTLSYLAQHFIIFRKREVQTS